MLVLSNVTQWALLGGHKAGAVSATMVGNDHVREGKAFSNLERGTELGARRGRTEGRIVIMTGPEHYRESERLLEHAEKIQRSEAFGSVLNFVRTANVHALLALAAAVGGLDAVAGPATGSATGRVMNDSEGWLDIVDPDRNTEG